MKYTIVHINNRAKDLMDKNKIILNSFEYVDSIPFFNGIVNDPWHELAARKIDVSAWKPYYERNFGPLPGELGLWISLLNIFNYILETKTKQMLVIEDDAILTKNAARSIGTLIKELPESWDFLSLHYNSGLNRLTQESDIGSKKIHKGINQVESTVAIVYSYSFAKKFLDLVQENGIEHTVDTFLFRQTELGLINGYSIIPNSYEIVKHGPVESIIDPKNIRHPDGRIV
jgi:GR25 family glycosyltransferase involved in LPS biosynthesis